MRGTQVRLGDDALDAILRQAFGGRHGVSATVLGGGQINDTRLLTWPDGVRRILRIAPSDATAAAGPSWFTAYGLRREAAVIAATHELAASLPVTIAHDFDRAVIDRDWVIQEVMPGIPLSEVDRQLTESVREDVWQQVGAFTRRLNTVTGAWFGVPAYGPRFETWPALLAADVAALREDATRFGYPERPFARLGRIVRNLDPFLDAVRRPALVHSDLARSHIFVAPEAGRWRLAGVIDLEFGRFADPRSEHLIVGFAYDNTPAEMLAAFMRGYGNLDIEPVLQDLYVALDLAWFAPLLAMQHEPTDDLLHRLGVVLDRLERDLAA